MPSFSLLLPLSVRRPAGCRKMLPEMWSGCFLNVGANHWQSFSPDDQQAITSLIVIGWSNIFFVRIRIVCSVHQASLSRGAKEKEPTQTAIQRPAPSSCADLCNSMQLGPRILFAHFGPALAWIMTIPGAMGCIAFLVGPWYRHGHRQLLCRFGHRR